MKFDKGNRKPPESQEKHWAPSDNDTNELSEIIRVENPEVSFEENIEAYIKDRIGFYQTTTLKEQRRKLRYFGRIYENLKDERRVDTTDPEKIGRVEISAFLQYMRDIELDTSTQKKYIIILNGYLKFHRNDIIPVMKARNRFPAPKNKPIKSLTVEEVQRIFDTAQGMKGWAGSQARGLIALAFETLARPSEIRLAYAKDLDLSRGRFFIRNPKGKGSYASGEWVDLLRPDIRPLLWRYMDEREIYLTSRGKTSDYLFPNIRSENGYFSSNSIREKIRNLSKLSEVDFSLRDFRATGTNFIVSADKTKLNAISSQLRHSNVGTTQRYYADIRSGSVAEDIGDTWKKTEIGLDRKR